ncbi:MAG TPA: DUF5610 domain-containing protein [Cellvibrio sp.]|nr:DUF5610 domain-containing protein [Cellvibrio sp.]
MNISSLTPGSSKAPVTNTVSSDVSQASSKELDKVRSLSLTDKGVDSSSQESLQERRQAALSLVDRTLTAAYEKISSRSKAGVEAYKNVEPLTPAKVAGNILGFIERRLQMDAAEGASQEQLQSRLEAGLAGFNKGFAEASEQLKALNMLSPEIAADIGETKDLVLKGIDDLRSKFIKATEPGTEQVKVTSGTQPTVTDQPAAASLPAAPAIKSTAGKTPNSVQLPGLFSGVGANKAPGSGNYNYASASEFSFELITAEGDKVTIKASASMGISGQTTAKGYDVGMSSSQSMSLSVDGDLSDEELKAINDLIGRVDKLAGQFFAGNLDDAFNQAVSLGYDKSQIGSFALQLAQVEIEIVDEPEEAIEVKQEKALQQDPTALSTLSGQLYPLGGFIQYLLDTLDLASMFDDPEGLLSDISKKMVGEDDDASVQGERFDDFIQQLLELDLQRDVDDSEEITAPA